MKTGHKFSLIELVVVLALITLLAAMTLGVGHTYRRRTRISRTKSTIQKLQVLLDNLHGGDWDEAVWIEENFGLIPAEELGQYESDLDSEEVKRDADAGLYVVVDGWNRPIQVRKGGDNAPGLDIRSAGPGGDFEDDEDNIVNWGRAGQW